MDHFTSTENQPWWADVAHLRDDAAHTPVALVDEPAPRVERPRSTEAERTVRSHSRARAAGRPGRAPRERAAVDRAPADWFAQEAGVAGRRTEPTSPAPTPSRPTRPRATLVDVAPDHAMLSRPIAVRRAPGERPTVTITGRPDAALPPRPPEPRQLRGRRTREQATALIASPDRLILWAVALGLLMILASIGTASADAAVLLP